MDFNSNSNQTDFLWPLLENPANDAGLYAYNLRRLVDEFPQSGVLQALLAHASDEKNLKRASAYFAPRALFKLINAPSTFTGIPADRIFIQPGISTNGAHPVVEAPAISEPGYSDAESHHIDELVVDKGAPVMEPGVEAPARTETGELVTDHGADEYLSHLSEAPAHEHIPGEEPQPVESTHPVEEAINEPVYEETASELHDHVAESMGESVAAANVAEGSAEHPIETYREHQPVVEAGYGLTEDHAVAEQSSHQIETAQAENVHADEAAEPLHSIWTNEEMPPVPDAVEHHGEEMAQEAEPAHVQNIHTEEVPEPIADLAVNEIPPAPVAGFEQHWEEPVQTIDLQEEHFVEPVAEIPLAEERIPEPEPIAPAEEMEETYDEIVSIEDIRIDEHSTGSFFTFDQEFGAHEDETSEKADENEIAETQQEAGHQDISQYHDEKMPYTFLWWLDKTRKEHAQVYQPYTKPPANPAKKGRKAIDMLQQQYIENIFHINSVEALDKSTPSSATAPDLKKKEQTIIERFIREEPQIKPQSSDKLDNENKARKSSEDRDELVTETLAGIYSDQMLYHKAISSYKKLMLKFPEKSRYFAGKIEQLEKKTN